MQKCGRSIRQSQPTGLSFALDLKSENWCLIASSWLNTWASDKGFILFNCIDLSWVSYSSCRAENDVGLHLNISNHDVSVLKFREVRNFPSLPLISGLACLVDVVSVSVPSMGQIDLFVMMFKMIINCIQTMTLKTLLLPLSVKCFFFLSRLRA